MNDAEERTVTVRRRMSIARQTAGFLTQLTVQIVAGPPVPAGLRRLPGR